MARHVIIGKGNLGLDLEISLKKLGHEVNILTRSEGFKWPDSYQDIFELQPACVWYTAGFGSVEQCAKDPNGALDTHVVTPMGLARTLHQHVGLVLFSTDYAADEFNPESPGRRTQSPRSFYAMTKIWMEQAIMHTERPRTSIIRVGSLYGSHFPEKTFPGKIRRSFPDPCEVKLPENRVCPTPTWWVSDMVSENINRLFNERYPMMHHVAPSNGCTVANWGKVVLGEGYNIVSSGYDASRPAFSNLGCTLGKVKESWVDLWLRHLQRAQSVEGQKTSGL